MKKYLSIFKKYSFILSSAALILYVIFEAGDSLIGAIRGYKLFDFDVIFNIALIFAGVLMLLRKIKYAAIPFGVAALIDFIWLSTYTSNLLKNLLNFGSKAIKMLPLGSLNVFFSYFTTISGLLAMLALGALCVFVFLGRMPKSTKLWYIPTVCQLAAFVLGFFESTISFTVQLFSPVGFLMKLLCFYDFIAATVIGLLLLLAVAFTNLAIYTYTLLPQRMKY